MKIKKKNDDIDTRVVASQLINTDGYGKATIRLKVEWEKKAISAYIVELYYMVEHKERFITLRRFPTLLRAFRSYRRFVNLSDEIESGYSA